LPANGVNEGVWMYPACKDITNGTDVASWAPLYGTLLRNGSGTVTYYGQGGSLVSAGAGTTTGLLWGRHGRG
jgi:hypothetical protein